MSSRTAPPTRGRRGRILSPRVLIVDDDNEARKVAAQTAKAHGCLVVEAGNVDEALRVLNEVGGISVVLTDMTAPGSISGTELAQHVKQQWPNVALIVTSSKLLPFPAPCPKGPHSSRSLMPVRA